MKLNYLSINQELEETTCHGSADYPMEVYTDEVSKYPEGYIIWHWHKECELIYVLEGTVEFCTGRGNYVLQQGEGAWIVPQMLHMMSSLAPGECTMCAILMDSSLLYGFPDSRIHRQFVKPLLEQTAADTYLFRPEVPWQKEILEHILRCYRLNEEKSFGYEWEMLILLQQAGFLLAQNTRELPRAADGSLSEHYVRVKKAMEFIHANYSRKLYLKDIADAIPISRCECCRSFQKIIRQSPVDYLITYRVQMAQYLLSHTSKSVLDIALETGFSNSSHLTRMFRRQLHCTPLEYRKKGR